MDVTNQDDAEHVHVHVHVHTPAERAAYRQAAISHTSSEPEGSSDRGDRQDADENHKPVQAGKDASNNGDKDEGTGKKEQRSRLPLIILGIVILVGVIAGVIYWLLTRDLVSTDDAYTDGRAIVMAPHISGYVSVLAVNDNQFVHKGDLLAQIEPSDYITARDEAAGQVAALEAQLNNARISVEKARTTYPAQLKLARGQLLQAQGQLFQASAEYRRQHLIERAATSQQNVDVSTANRQQAQGQVQQASAQVEQARLIEQNIAQAEAQVKQLEGQALQAKANYQQAEINLGYTRITAPQDGWVTKRNFEVGTYAQAGGQILAIVTPDVWVTANFKENQLARMRPGQHVRIRVDAYPDLSLNGHVDSIQHGSGSKFTAFPPENATGNYVKIVQRVPVKIIIDRNADQRIALPLGISVEPTVTLE